MVDFLSLDLNKFENQMLIFIDAYYKLLKENNNISLATEKNLIDEKWKKQIIDLLDDYLNKDESVFGLFSSRIKSIKKYLDKATRKGKLYLEFYMVSDIAEILYELYFNKKNRNKKGKSYMLNNMVRCINRDLIELRNKLSHDEMPEIEYILRFYEDQYFLIKYMKPSDSKIELSDYVIKDIQNNIYIYLSKLLVDYDKAFEFDYSLKKDSKENKELINICDNKEEINNEDINYETEKDIKNMFKSAPFKMSKYNFIKEDIQVENGTNKNINNENNKKEKKEIKGEKEEKMDKKDDGYIYEQSLESSSNNSYSNYCSSNTSGRNSINETYGNIKEEIDESVDKSQSNILNKY